MSLDITFYHVDPEYIGRDDVPECDTWSKEGNIEDASLNVTHNLSRMADNVVLSNNVTLYNVLWRGDEMSNPIKIGRDFTNYLMEALKVLSDNKEYLLQFNPENGWGDYDGLVRFTTWCLVNSIIYPNSLIMFDR